ncbi:lipid A-modifier LpxR family protein [Hymenobacter lutimineralis]|uniref:lipid A-modifier LpxR family protein n=1 Tax=Hymenobacter lutimineralis TaxID=2606448 RepID=UPI0016562E2E
MGQRTATFGSLGVNSKAGRAGQPRLQAYGEVQAEGRLVGYNATLQGGLLNHRNPYVLPASAIRRTIVVTSTGTVGLGYAGLRLEALPTWISPEFTGSRTHRWNTLGILVAF